MNSNTILATVAFLLISVVYFYFCGKKKKEIYERFTELEKEEKYEEAHQLANNGWSRFLLTKYDGALRRLNYAIALENDDLVDKAFADFSKVRTITPAQDVRLSFKAFDYYLATDNKQKIEYYYNKLMKIDDAALTKEIDCIYNTYYQNGYVYLDSKLEQLKHMKPEYRATTEFYISRMYENKGDMENSQKYLDLALKHTGMIGEESKITKKVRNRLAKEQLRDLEKLEEEREERIAEASKQEVQEA